MNRLIILILSMISLNVSVQSSVNEINSIKRNGNYMWAEATESTIAKATEAAKISLTLAIKNQYSSLGLEIIKSKVEGCAQITMPRGTMHRSFVYINKDKLASQTVEETITSPLSNVSVVDNSLKPWQQNLIGNLAKCSSVEDAVNFLDRMKSQNKVTQMGTKSSQPRNESKAFYIFFEKDLSLKAILGRDNNGQRMNYISNKQESLKDYSRNTLVWFTLPN